VSKPNAILIAGPTASGMSALALNGHVDAAENYSACRWCVDASAAIAEAGRAGHRRPTFDSVN
jgi:tRNA A37 N6-isopentenylltransferase MiaA